MAKILTLVVPGLLERWPYRNEPDFPRPEAAALELILGRASVAKTVAGAEATFFQLFGVQTDASADLPVAAVTRLADAGDSFDGWWLRADPVHLRADLHAVLLFDARFLGIDEDEARHLAAAFNRTFGAEGLILETPRPDRWYLRLPSDPGLRTQPLEQAAGRDINSLLPEGNAGRRWNALLTEIQMLFHGARVNAEREARGRPPINSVWFWGGGRLPKKAHRPAEDLYADDPVVRGLARVAGVALGSTPDNAADWRQSAADSSLVVLNHARYDRRDDDPHAWSAHLSVLDENWFGPCLALLKAGALNAFHLYPCNGRVYTLTHRGLWRLWRRRRSLFAFL